MQRTGAALTSLIRCLGRVFQPPRAQSLAATLRVGATIEDLDIIDLDLRQGQTDKADITVDYENLKQGSRNHLRSFTARLQTQAGERYQPQYLSQAAYEAMINSPIEKGRVR